MRDFIFVSFALLEAVPLFSHRGYKYLHNFVRLLWDFSRLPLQNSRVSKFYREIDQGHMRDKNKYSHEHVSVLFGISNSKIIAPPCQLSELEFKNKQ